MKTSVFLLLVIIICISCTKEESIDPKNVSITLNYAFPVKSGDITPKSSSEYLTFYNQYIKSKVLTPRTYYANLYDPDHLIGTSIYGTWGKESLFIVPPGRYIVEGTSKPISDISWNGQPITNSICGDTAYLKFSDTITVTQTSTSFTLNAQYDCALVLLDTTEVVDTYMFITDTTNLSIFTPYRKAVKEKMMKTEEFYHSFLFNGTLNGEGYDKVNLYLGVTTSRMEMIYPGPGTPSYDPPPPHLENISFTIPLWTYNMQSGKFYYFEQTQNGYELPPMSN